MTLLVGHGRAQRRLPNVDYGTANFLDKDPSTGPDLLVDIREKDAISPENTKQYSEIIAVNSESMILPELFRLGRSNRSLHTPTLENLDRLLGEAGRIYLKTPRLFDSEDFQREIEEKIGWEFLGILPAGDIFQGERGTYNIFEKIPQ